jgi:hypothetical protein
MWLNVYTDGLGMANCGCGFTAVRNYVQTGWNHFQPQETLSDRPLIHINTELHAFRRIKKYHCAAKGKSFISKAGVH